MNTIYGLYTKTALEHLIFLSGKNIVSVCKDLKITPQQFTDWLKHRRPIPVDKIVLIEQYFDIPASILVDNKRFTTKLSVLDSIDLETLVAINQLKTSDEQRIQELEYRINELKTERQKQIRIARLAAILDKNDSSIMSVLDKYLDELEKI